MNTQQGSEEWFAARLGKVTSSRIKDVMAKTKSGYSASRKNYMMQLLCERLTGRREETYTNAVMQRGIDLEPLAKSAYEILSGNVVEDVGFIEHLSMDTGTSPDGIVANSEGMLEVKCPNTAQHISCIQSGKADSKYNAQQQHQMWITGRQWNDFISFDDRLPEPLQLFVCRVFRDDSYIEKMVEEIIQFLSELDKLESDMRSRI